LSATTFINEQQVGLFFNRKRDGFGFTNLKFCLKGIGNGPKGQGFPFKPG
jgi:hypothetical protein